MMIRAHLSIGFADGACREEDIYVDDDSTDEDIADEVREWAHNYIEWSYKRLTDDDDGA